jgi:hypothetical protein
MSTLPQTPAALREELLAVFPGYRERATSAEDAPTFHAVLMDFVPYFGGAGIIFHGAASLVRHSD